MPSHVLIPIDGSDQALSAVSYATVLFPNADHTTLHVIDPTREWYEGPGLTEDWRERSQKQARMYHEQAHSLADQHGVSINSETVLGEPWREIVAFVEEHEVDHLSIGSTGKSLIPKVMFGSVAETIVRRSTIPVTIVRNRDPADDTAPERILVGLDGSEQSYAGLDYVVDEFPAVDILAVHVIDTVEGYVGTGGEGTYVEAELDRARSAAETILANAADRAGGRSIDTHFEFGDAATTINSIAKAEDIDHIVVGSHGKSGVKRILLGSVAEKITRRAHVPVTIVR